MKIDEIKGLNKPTRERLRRAGIRSAEQLALVDSRRKKIQGITPTQLSRLKRTAQRTIWEGALRRVRSAADETFESLEGTLQEATWATVDAAKLAQQRAEETVSAAQKRARVLARVAAAKTREAASTAEQEYRSILRQFRRASTKERRTLRAYEERARRAADAAKRASAAAKRAVELANQRWRAEIKLAARRGVGLVERLRQRIEGGNGGPG